MTVTQDKTFKTAMSRFLTGVTIVSCYDKSGAPYGLTVNSFASVSLHPQLVLWSLIKDSTKYDDFCDAAGYSIALLAQDQSELCMRFASNHEDRFEGVSWEKGQHGLPVIQGALSVLECHPYAQYDGGDHTIFVGEVKAIHNAEEDLAPLSYFAGKVNAL